MIMYNAMTVSVSRTEPRAELILGAPSLPFLPAPTSGQAPAAAPATRGADVAIPKPSIGRMKTNGF